MNKLIVFLIILLSACSSTKYYLLNDLEINNAPKIKGIFALRKINIPDYLQQEYVLIKSNSEIKRLPNSKWIESLSNRIPNLIYQGLSKDMQLFHYPLAPEIYPDKIIDIEINEFIADEISNSVIIKAEWLIISDEKIISHQYLTEKITLNNKDIALSYQQALNTLITKIRKSF